ncbi:hypothetical protein QSV34_07000 [Porticoccus sp. W117]|uniref:hypothetical protein n=1 Tax=Porticoccus sp. W117 TaxID=3054777 RepID=UPI00259801A4|nr:hypothetical protein [Porticoccus sp. W117]MDM3871103.1 hypothetical protein [Porticoccus sp. W117]
MHFACGFETSKFDVTKEQKNPINPIYGESLLLWLKDRLLGQLEITVPEAEDWGWYSYVNWKGRQYMLGASAYFDEGDDPNEEVGWVFQLTKERSLKEVLLFQEKMKADDECLIFFTSIFNEDSDFHNIVRV